jgi:hypothetical protein
MHVIVARVGRCATRVSTEGDEGVRGPESQVRNRDLVVVPQSGATVENTVGVQYDNGVVVRVGVRRHAKQRWMNGLVPV